MWLDVRPGNKNSIILRMSSVVNIFLFSTISVNQLFMSFGIAETNFRQFPFLIRFHISREKKSCFCVFVVHSTHISNSFLSFPVMTSTFTEQTSEIGKCFTFNLEWTTYSSSIERKKRKWEKKEKEKVLSINFTSLVSDPSRIYLQWMGKKVAQSHSSGIKKNSA